MGCWHTFLWAPGAHSLVGTHLHKSPESLMMMKKWSFGKAKGWLVWWLRTRCQLFRRQKAVSRSKVGWCRSCGSCGPSGYQGVWAPDEREPSTGVLALGAIREKGLGELKVVMKQVQGLQGKDGGWLVGWHGGGYKVWMGWT